MLCLSASRRDDDPCVQRLLGTIEEAHTLPELILAAWSLARVLARHLGASGLTERARRPMSWPCCPQCGAGMRRQGFVKRQVISLIGPLRWQRRVGRGPQGCEPPPVAPLDDDLGVPPHQRPSGALQHLGCALAVFVPFATAATLLGWASGVAVRPRAVWEWGQVAGQRAMEQLHTQWPAAAAGPLPPEEPLTAAVAAMPLALGADGGRVPLRPEGGQARGQTAWHEVKVGVVARLGRARTRTGKSVARLPQRRWVAVFGDLEALQRRLGLEGRRQGIRQASQVVWLRDGARGLWRLFEGYVTDSATGLVDFDQAGQPLWKGAAAWLDGRTSHARRWVRWARHRLRQGNPDGVLADLADAVDVEGLPETARQTLRTVDAYLARHREHITYAM